MNPLKTFNIPPLNRSLSSELAILIITIVALVSGCGTTKQFHSTSQVRSISLDSKELTESGIAFLTPTSVTGLEESKQALALAFTETMKSTLPNMRIVPLPESIGTINSAGLAGEYKQMYEDSRLTGIFNKDTLKKISQVTGVRYLAQLKLSGFQQGLQERWGFLGIRLLETQTTSMRLYLQIFDGETGAITWEGSQELTASLDTLKDMPIAFNDAVEQSAKELIARLP